MAKLLVSNLTFNFNLPLFPVVADPSFNFPVTTLSTTPQ